VASSNRATRAVDYGNEGEVSISDEQDRGPSAPTQSGGSFGRSYHCMSYIITALVPLAFSALAVSAVRALRPPGWLPETLMAAGAAIVVAASGWLDWLFSQRQLQDLPFALLGWLVTLPNGLFLVGLLAVGAGFTVAGLVGAEQ